MTSVVNFPVLYKASNNKTLLWEISVVENESGTHSIRTVRGYVDHKLVTSSEEITMGKNIGRSNETSPRVQAELQANSKYKKKLNEGGTCARDLTATNIVIYSVHAPCPTVGEKESSITHAFTY